MRESLARPKLSVRHTRRRGYTLLELMLVLAVLTVIVSIAWPSLRKPLHRSAVQQAAGQLVKDLGQARLAAIEYGQIIRFRYEPGGTRYVLDLASAPGDGGDDASADVMTEPSADDREVSLTSDTESTFNLARTSGDDRQRDQVPVFSLRRELPDEVVFRDPAEVNDPQAPPGSILSDSLAKEASEREEVKPLIDRTDEESDLSAPVFFYPNGRAENAELVLVGPDEYRLTVRVRGLTGAASLGPPEHFVRD